MKTIKHRVFVYKLIPSNKIVEVQLDIFEDETKAQQALDEIEIDDLSSWVLMEQKTVLRNHGRCIRRGLLIQDLKEEDLI